MTRKKAIEIAENRAWEAYEEDDVVTQSSGCNLLASVAASEGWEFGFAAGLMEGARMAMNDGGWSPTIGDIQKRSRVLVRALKNK